MKSTSHLAVLTTINAPYKTYMAADDLALALLAGDFKSPQVCSFFTEIPQADQLAFAKDFGVPKSVLQKTADEFSAWSGHLVALAA